MYKYLLSFVLVLIITHTNAQLSVNALLFDGVDDRVTIPANAAYNVGTGDFTVEMWIRASTVAGGSGNSIDLFSNALNPSFDGMRIYLSQGRPMISLNGSGIGATTDLRDSVCHHIAFTRTTGIVRIYIDGQYVVFNNLGSNLSTSGPLSIGYSGTGISQTPFKGSVKEVRFWNIARSAADILTGMSTVYTTATGLIGNWRMNVSIGQTITDLSSTANNGVRGLTSAVGADDPSNILACPPCSPPPVSVTVGGPTTFCMGGSVVLTANTGTGFTYQWYKNGIALSGSDSVQCTAWATGNYTVRITTPQGCYNYSAPIAVTSLLSDAGSVTVNGTPFGSYACVNGVSATLMATGNPSYTYQWKRNGNVIPGGQTLVTTTPGVYNCVVSSGVCSRTSSSVNVDIWKVTINTLTPVKVCQGPVSLSASLNFGNFASYQWKLNGNNISGATFQNYDATVSGLYTVEATNANICSGGTITSPVQQVQIGVVPDVIINPAPVTGTNLYQIDTCTSGTFHVNIYGFNIANEQVYEWDKDGSPVFNWIGPDMDVTEPGIYTAFVNTQCGIASLPPVAIRLIDPNRPPVIQHGSLTACPSVALSMVDYWDSYQWFYNGNPIPGATTFQYTAQLSGLYTCTVSNTCGSVTTPAVNVNVSGPGSSVTYTGSPTIPTLCNGPVTFFAHPTTPGLTFKWLRNNNVIAGATSSQYTASVAGDYRLVVSNSCKSDTSTVINLLATAPLPGNVGNISGPAKLCQNSVNNTYSVAAVTNATGYLWVVSNGLTIVSGAGTRTIKVNVSAGYIGGFVNVKAISTCGGTPYVTRAIGLSGPPTPGAITGQPNNLCGGVSKTYSIAAVAGATGYNWTVPSGATLVQGQNTTTVSVLYPSSFAVDTLKVTAINSCGSSAAKKLTVKGKPATPSSITGAATACNGQANVTYTTPAVGGATDYHWQVPSGSIITSGQGTRNLTVTFGANSGNVGVRVSNACGTTSYFNKAVTINCREGLTDDLDVTISPNPSSGNFKINTSAAGKLSITVLDGIGRMVFMNSLIDLSDGYKFGDDLPAGIYYVIVSNDNAVQRIPVVKL